MAFEVFDIGHIPLKELECRRLAEMLGPSVLMRHGIVCQPVKQRSELESEDDDGSLREDIDGGKSDVF